jgi:hypothetical protein
MQKRKSNYFQQRIKDCEKIDPKATWKLINSLVGKSHKSNHVTEIEVEDKNTVHGSEINEEFNDYFINIGPKLAAESTSNSSNNVHKYLKTNKLNYPLFSFVNVLVDNVLLTLRHLQTSKSTGLDNISAKMLKIVANIIAPSLTNIFNLSLSTGIFIVIP